MTWKRYVWQDCSVYYVVLHPWFQLRIILILKLRLKIFLIFVNELPYWGTIQDVFTHLDINELRDIQKYFSYESKAYSKRKIQKLIKLQEYKPNGINILRLYLKSYKNHEKVTLKKEKLNFDILVLQNLVDLKNHI